MKVSEYLTIVSNGPNPVSSEGVPLADALLMSKSVWSNKACNGYCFSAMELAGLDNETIRKVMNQLQEVYELLTVEKAETIYK